MTFFTKTSKTLTLATVFAAIALSSVPTLAGQTHHTCTGLRGCENFASACAAAGGEHSVDTPSTPGGGPIVNHCSISENRSGSVTGFKAKDAQQQSLSVR